MRFEEKVGTDDSSWTLSDDGLTLRYPFVEAGKEFSLVVSPDLLAADGSRLGGTEAEGVQRRAEAGGRLRLAGQRAAAKDSRGLPVVSVNVPEVDVEFLRVRGRTCRPSSASTSAAAAVAAGN